MAEIKFGVRWPDYDLPIERGTIRVFLQGIEEMGYDHVTHMDHLVGMTDATLGSGTGESHFTDEMAWGESLTMMTYMAGMSNSLGFLTSIFVLPSRPTVLVAKQISTIDSLTEGRFRLGVSIGWNRVEFDMLGAEFANRAARYEEQIDVLRTLWTTSPVSYHGKWHEIPEVTMQPLPVQRPVPIWMGMSFEPPPVVLERIGRLADGFLPPWPPGDKTREYIERIYGYVREAGRDPSQVGFEGRINLRTGYGKGPAMTPMKDDEEIASQINQWADMGATHIEFKTRSSGLKGLDQQLEQMARFKSIADDVLMHRSD